MKSQGKKRKQFMFKPQRCLSPVNSLHGFLFNNFILLKILNFIGRGKMQEIKPAYLNSHLDISF